MWPWAKTNCDRRAIRSVSDPDFRYLGLTDHNLDVGAAALSLLETGRFDRALMRILEAPPTIATKQWLARLAAAHDAPKASHTFQGMMPACGVPASPYVHHAAEGAALVLGAAQDDEARQMIAALPLFPTGDPQRDALQRRLLLGAVCHHGAILSRDFEPRVWRPAGTPQRDPAEALRLLGTAIAQAFPAGDPTHAQFPDPDERSRSGAVYQHFVVGLIALADWIGSNPRWFPLIPPDQAGRTGFDRMAEARKAVAEAGIGMLIGRTTFADEAALVRAYTAGKASAFRPVQRAVLTALYRHAPEPGAVLLLEDETGSGKSLVAHAVHLDLARRGLVDGLAFLLPLRAAAKKLYQGARRIADAAGQAALPGMPVPVLAIPAYCGPRFEDFLRGSTPPRPPAPSAPQDGDGTGWQNQPIAGGQRLERPGWAQRMRESFFAAPLAVGTIDQALLSAMPTRHTHLVAFCLLGDLLVIDEVHASDPYMATLLAEVIRRHRLLGGSVLLMSATLGRHARARLFGQDSHQRIPSGPYPALWRDGALLAALPRRDGESKTVRVRLVPRINDIAWIAARAIRRARHGARVLVIRNTVAAAQALARLVAMQAPDLAFAIDGVPSRDTSRVLYRLTAP